MFERSPYGVQNRAIFLRVKYVIYTEGEHKGGLAQSVDQAFWTRIMKIFRPDLGFTILAKGGKPEVLKFASYVIENDVRGTAIALDRDYDDLCNTIINDPRVVYTYGYSWENDVLCRKVCTGIIKHILFASAPRRTTRTLATHNEMVRKFIWLSIADQIGVRNHHGIISRKGYRKYLSRDGDGKVVYLRHEKLAVTQLRAKQPLLKTNIDMDLHRRLFGKLYLFILLFVLRKEVVPSGRRFTDDEFLSSLFNAFNQISRSDINRHARSYYKRALAGL